MSVLKDIDSAMSMKNLQDSSLFSYPGKFFN